MDYNALISQFPNLALAIFAIWYLIGQNKDLRDQLNAASESRLKQLENVIAAMHATATALTSLTEKVNDKCGSKQA